MTANRRTRRLFLLLGIGSLAAGPLAAATSSWIRNPQSSVRLVTPYTAAPRSGDVRLGVEFELAPGWHAYWRNPGSAGFPPALDSQTPQLRVLETRWPAPSRFDLPGDLVAFGYAGAVLYPLRGHLDAEGDSLRMVINVDYLVCEIECVPYRYDMTLDQPLAESAVTDPEGEAAIAAWEARVPAAAAALPGFGAAGSLRWRDETSGDLHLAFTGAGGRPELFLDVHGLLEFGRPARQPGEGVEFVVPAERRDASRPLPRSSDVVWTLVGVEGAAVKHVEGRASVALAGGQRVDWRWVAAAVVFTAALIALLVRRPRSPG
jgi:DsbC/DsbD-like thiol-disulfide interchange protein